MKRIAMVVFGIVLATGLAYGQSGGKGSVEETLKKMEHDWTDARSKRRCNCVGVRFWRTIGRAGIRGA